MPLDYKEYPKDWKQIRERILEREKNRCKHCGLPNYSIIYKATRLEINAQDYSYYNDLREKKGKAYALTTCKLTQIVLTIAHLDHDKENHEVTDERLAALCQKCHLQYDLPRHINNRKYGRNHTKNQKKLF